MNDPLLLPVDQEASPPRWFPRARYRRFRRARPWRGARFVGMVAGWAAARFFHRMNREAWLEKMWPLQAPPRPAVPGTREGATMIALIDTILPGARECGAVEALYAPLLLPDFPGMHRRVNRLLRLSRLAMSLALDTAALFMRGRPFYRLAPSHREQVFGLARAALPGLFLGAELAAAWCLGSGVLSDRGWVLLGAPGPNEGVDDAGYAISWTHRATADGNLP